VLHGRASPTSTAALSGSNPVENPRSSASSSTSACAIHASRRCPWRSRSIEAESWARAQSLPHIVARCVTSDRTVLWADARCRGGGGDAVGEGDAGAILILLGLIWIGQGLNILSEVTQHM